MTPWVVGRIPAAKRLLNRIVSFAPAEATFVSSKPYDAADVFEEMLVRSRQWNTQSSSWSLTHRLAGFELLLHPAT